MLIGILLSEKDDAIRAVRENLEVFYKYAGGDPEHVQPIDVVPPARSPPLRRDLELLGEMRSHICRI